MKSRTTLAALTLALSSFVICHSSFAQGSLTPPGAPAPTMKSLSQIEPRIPISSLPITITSPGSYYLTTNLTSSGTSHGITISSGNVTIDLSGFALQGINSSAWSGIYVADSYTNLVFRNGTVTGWAGSGIDTYSANYPRNMLFEHLTVSGNGGDGINTEAGSIIRDCIAYGNNEAGFESHGGEIIGCLAYNNLSAGFVATYCSLLHCSAEYNVFNGFTLNYSRALDCDSHNNSSYGISCAGSGDEIRRCQVLNNNGAGVYCAAGVSSYVVEDCEIAGNAGGGIYTYGTGVAGGAYIARNNLNLNSASGMTLNDNNNFIEDNHILAPSGAYGLAINGTNCVVARNVVTGGGANNYNIYFQNDVGPIGSASSASSPWANISH